MNAEATKQALRTHYLTMRKKLSLAEQLSASEKVCGRIRAQAEYQTAKHIAIYHAVNGEISLSSLQDKACYFPVINADQTLSFLPVTAETVFHKNRFGIPEPDVKRELALMPEQLDIIFMPLVAFDEHGTRIGMGAGFYDRTLAHHRSPLLIGVAYEFQRQSFIEPNAWDVPLSGVITEQSTYWSKP